MTQDAVTRQHWLTTMPNPGGMIYGAVISASVLATVSAHGEAYSFVAIATGFVLGVYWLTHVYVEAQRLQLAGDARHAVQRLAHTAVHELSVVQGGLPAIVVFLVAKLVGADTSSAAAWAVYFSVALLVVVGWVTATQSGRTGRARVVDAVVAGLFGVVVIVAKALLH